MVMKGQKISGRYQIMQNIDEGEVSSTYLAYDTIKDYNVAVKLLNRDLIIDERFFRKFQNEILSEGSLNHPNIAKAYNIVKDNDDYYVISEYIEGTSLKNLLKKRGKLTASEVIDIMLQITDAISVAHDSQILHRNINSQNILLMQNGLVQVTDFGIGMAMNAIQLAQTNLVTAQYISPEQKIGRDATPQSDVYSMGVLMYELLTGKLPNHRENYIEDVSKNLKEEMVNIKEKLPNLSNNIEKIILKAISENPQNRYENANEMHEDLKSCENDSHALLDLKYRADNIYDPKVGKMLADAKTMRNSLKKQNTILAALASVFGGLVALVASIVLFTPMMTSGQEIEVPDVTNMTVKEAIKTIQNEGFKVEENQKERSSSEIAEGHVIKTEPSANSKQSKNTAVTLYVSSGSENLGNTNTSDKITIEDYIGKNSSEIKEKLESLGIQVSIESRKVDDETKYDDGEIIDQSVKAGESLSAGDEITLYIPNSLKENNTSSANKNSNSNNKTQSSNNNLGNSNNGNSGNASQNSENSNNGYNKDDGKCTMNCDTNGDGKPDTNIDTDKDGKPNVNLDPDGDGKPNDNLMNQDTDNDGVCDLNCDTNKDGFPDTNIDHDGDGKPDTNIDTNKDGKPDTNIDTDKDGKPNANLDPDGDGKPNDNLMNQDIDNDGVCDLNCDTNKDGFPDTNIDHNGDGKPDTNIDTDKDGKPNVNLDPDGDGKPNDNLMNQDNDNDGVCDLNCDTNKDGFPDTNIDHDGDGICDENCEIDTDGDGVCDENCGNSEEDKPNNSEEDSNDTLYLSSLSVVDKNDKNYIKDFKKETLTYNITVENDIDEVNILAQTSDSKVEVSGTGTKPLKTGTNPFNIILSNMETGNTTIYSIVITKKASNDSSLKSLSIEEGKLNETFNSKNLSYTANLGNSIDKVTIKAETNNSKATVSGIGEFNLKTGKNTFQIEVTAEDNTTTTYKLVITRQKSSNSNLSNLSVVDENGNEYSTSYDENTSTYETTVPNKVEKVNIEAFLEDDKARYVVKENTNFAVKPTATIINKTNFKVRNLATPINDDSTVDLEIGKNSFEIIVTAEDDSEKTYYVDITRQKDEEKSNNTYLSDLRVEDNNSKNYIEEFNKEQFTYNIIVENDIDEVYISATKEENSTIILGDIGNQKLNVGPNTFTVKTKSESGKEGSYTINIERKISSDATLSSLSIIAKNQNGEDTKLKLVPDFAPDTYEYSLNVESVVDSIEIIAEAKVASSKVTGQTGKQSLQTGLNVFKVEVQSEDGTNKNTYEISINKATSSNNYLASLLVDKGSYQPIFNREILNYSMTVPNDVKNITVSAIAEDENATVTGDGLKELMVGHNQVAITVTAENNMFRKYELDIYREPSNNNYLSTLKVQDKDGTNYLEEKFNKDNFEYDITVPNDITELDIIATAEDENAKVTGNGKVDLTTGDNTITVCVTAEDGDTQCYNLNITRKKSSNNNISLLQVEEGELSPKFESDTTNYNVTVPYETDKLTLTVELEDEKATYEVRGNQDLTPESDNTVEIIVTAEDGTENVYQIKVTHLPKASNFLKSLTVTGKNKQYDLDPEFNETTYSYSVTVDADDNVLTISGELEDSDSKVKGLETITIDEFPYQHKVIVTNNDISRTYTINFDREKSSNADLKDLKIKEGILTPTFDPNVLDYEATVTADIDSIDIIAQLNPGQTVVGDGTHNLEYGDNKFNIVVTAEDGTTKTYTINVEREKDVPATLSNIIVNNGVLSPTFNNKATSYLAYIGEGALDITITPIVTNPQAKMTMALNSDDYQDITSITIDDFSIENTVKIKVEGIPQTQIYTVIIADQSEEEITSKIYGHNISTDGMITTVTESTTSLELKDQLDNHNSKLKIYESNGTTVLSDEQVVGTGMIVKLFEKGSVVDSKVIVVKGEVNGDCEINSLDELKVENHVLGTSNIVGGAYLVAADITNDSKIDILDEYAIEQYILNKK